jgi:uncharacterized protein (UPF0332 family)
MTDPYRDVFLAKAEESLAGAVSEYVNGRYNNSANRAYYACFQAAVAALVDAGIGRPDQAEHWGHDFVQAQFIGQLINRRKRYPATLRETLVRGQRLRQTADYTTERISDVQASRNLARARAFVAAIQNREGDRS